MYVRSSSCNGRYHRSAAVLAGVHSSYVEESTQPMKHLIKEACAYHPSMFKLQ
jgi:hypothetical protein